MPISEQMKVKENAKILNCIVQLLRKPFEDFVKFEILYDNPHVLEKFFDFSDHFRVILKKFDQFCDEKLLTIESFRSIVFSLKEFFNCNDQDTKESLLRKPLYLYIQLCFLYYYYSLEFEFNKLKPLNPKYQDSFLDLENMRKLLGQIAEFNQLKCRVQENTDEDFNKNLNLIQRKIDNNFKQFQFSTKSSQQQKPYDLLQNNRYHSENAKKSHKRQLHSRQKHQDATSKYLIHKDGQKSNLSKYLNKETYSFLNYENEIQKQSLQYQIMTNMKLLKELQLQRALNSKQKIQM